jgi:hypothetical protein
MFTPLRAMARDPEGKALVLGVVATLAVGTVVYSALEGWSLIDSLYFSVVALATVGFGDLTPTTDVAKLFTVGYILVGIGILAAFVSELTKHRQPGRAVSGRLPMVSRVEHEVQQEIEQAVDAVERGDPVEGDKAS